MLNVSKPHAIVRTLAVATLLVCGAWAPFRSVSWAAPDDAPAPSAEAEVDDPGRAALDAEQEAIAQRFRLFEKNLVVMARYLRKVQPERAELIERVVTQSKGRQLGQQMQAIVALLESGALGDAFDRQGEVVGELRSLLKLLQSGDRMDEIEREKARIKDLIKDLNRVIRNEKDVRADTERGGDPDELAQRQGKIAGQTRNLVDKIDGQDAARRAANGEGKPGEGKPGEGKPGEGKPGEGKPGEGKPGEGKPGEGKPGEGKPGEGKPGEGKPGEGKPGEGKPGEGKPGEGKPGEGKPGEGKPGEGKPGEGKPGEGKPGEGKPGEGQPGDPSDSDEYPNKTPGRNEIEQARRDMERAIEELKRRENEAASKHQDDALAKLQQAREKLEEILRQLREEERKLLLAALEARFQRMLDMQRRVYAGTVALARVPEFDIAEISRAKQLAGDEQLIAVEADKALTLLKEEGSSVAFPEAVEQLREDIVLVARRLHPDQPATDPRPDVGELTQAIEKDVIEALEELIEALQKEMEKAREKEQKPKKSQQGEPPDPKLVDKLAELKMLRSLQLRINRRTKRLGRAIEGEQATEDEVVDQLRGLAGRQQSIQEATYDLATGRNQ